MPNQTTILAQHGLIKADTATPKDWETIDNIRDKRFSIPLSWEQIQQLLAKHPTIRPYLYLSTGLDGLVLLNTNTGETANTQPLIFENLSDENDSMFSMVEQHISKWDRTTPTKTLIQQGRTDEAKRQIDHATALAPTALMELVYQLVPWKELHDRQYQRMTALNVRKNEEYPSRQFDRHLVKLLQQTKPLHWGRGCFGEDVRQAYNSVQGGNRQERAFGFELDDQPENRQRICRTLQHERHHILDSAQAR